MHRVNDEVLVLAKPALAVALSIGVACQEPSPVLDISSPERANEHGPANHPVDTDVTGDAATDDDGPSPEVCDGWDNDKNGEVDEGTGGGACTTDGAAEGTSECVNGRLICRECTPGATRQVDCGCDAVLRVDICNDVGRWLEGACSGCSRSIDDSTCGFCGFRVASGECVNAGECEPGDVKYVRCDACPPGDPNCGVSCYGEKWICTGSCEWQKVEGCAARIKDCNQDQVLYQECGMCGHQKIECDGCFWMAGDCQDEGICAGGTTAIVPCFGNSCTTGFYSTLRCNDSCEWETESTCSGCVPGPPEYHTSDCMPGHSCGQRTTMTQCVATAQSTCNGDTTLTLGHATSEVVADGCQIACTPGQTRSASCSVGGCAGKRNDACDDSCQWQSGTCIQSPAVCNPATGVETRTEACASGVGTLTETRSCTACGQWSSWSVTSSCPAVDCSPGSTRTVSCGTSGCGSATQVCDSSGRWGSVGTCSVPAMVCTPGVTETDSSDCACGGTAASSRTCDSCGAWGVWYAVSSCSESCSAADKPSTSCSVGGCTNGTRSVSCSTCEWVTGACTLPSCTPSTQTLSCASSCGGQATYTYTTSCDACGNATTTSNEASACPSLICNPGETRSGASCGHCGQTLTETCNSTCTGWVAGVCPPDDCG